MCARLGPHVKFIETGNPNARVMIVGEAPGRLSIQRGRPFTGTSGLRMLRAEVPDLDRRVIFSDAIRCLPPGNRTPRADERRACRPFLLQEIDLVRPRRIICFGRVALRAVLGHAPDIPVPQWLPLHRKKGAIPVIAMPHPAYAMRQKRAYRERYRRVWRRLARLFL